MATATRRLDGKVALITGGASGIGECTAKLFAEHGAKVVIADIQDELGQAVCEDVIGLSNSLYVHCDVTSEEDVKKAVDIAVTTFGKLDIMFNNAGIVDPYKARIIDNEKPDFERVLSVNVTGVFLGMKHAARVMVPARAGSIISTTSVASNWWCGHTCLHLRKARYSWSHQKFGSRAWTVWHSSQLCVTLRTGYTDSYKVHWA